MSVKLQEELTKLYAEPISSDDLWHRKPNSWTRELSARERNEVAIEIATRALGAKRTRPGTEYAVLRDGQRIAVKVASIGTSNGKPLIVWQSIQMGDIFTHICFIALYPDDVRLFLVPRADIDVENLSLKRGSESSYQLATRNIHNLFGWMTKHEVHEIVRA